jgi:hypothetical protein
MRPEPYCSAQARITNDKMTNDKFQTAALLHARSAAITICKESYEGSDSPNPVYIKSPICAAKPSVIGHWSFSRPDCYAAL